jgi:N-acetylmuramoyl-L-alanine amidase
MKNRQLLIGLILIIVLLPLKLFAHTITISNIRVNHLKHTWQYVIDMSGVVPVTRTTANHPYRKLFKFYHTRTPLKLTSSFGANATVHKIYLIQHGNYVLLSLHLAKPLAVHATYWSPDGRKGNRYVIEVDQAKLTSHHKVSTQINFNRAKALANLQKTVAPKVDAFVDKHLLQFAAIPVPHSKLTEQSVQSRKTSKSKIPAPHPLKAQQTDNVQLPALTAESFAQPIKRASKNIIVVIDAGHGGKDPGATGPRGTHEKRVVLQIAHLLKQSIDRYPGFKAVLTRSDDRYLTLRRRLALARIYHGDMFVAIHADAFINSRAHGASVFALSQRGATSEAARWLAERENQSELMGGVDLADKDRLLRSVLIDLSQTATIGASLKIGSGMITNLRQIVPMHANRVEQAAFVVLKSPDIPSLLVETGFISNPTEEQQLILRSHQQKLANAMARGIVRYFHTHPPRGTWIVQHRASLQVPKVPTLVGHVVHPGESLSMIAQQHNTTVKALLHINHLYSSLIHPYQVLQVPA